MADNATLANQKKILANQAAITANQKKILANQVSIKENQRKIMTNQKKILGLVEASAEEIGKARRVAFLASRTNTMLSIPMLMSMIGSHHGFFI